MTEIKLTKDAKVKIGEKTYTVSANKTFLLVYEGHVDIVHHQHENQKPGEGMQYSAPIFPSDDMAVNDIVEKFKIAV